MLLIGLLYGQSIGYSYTLDDKIVIVDNEYVKEGISGIGKIFSTESFQGYFGEQKNLVAGSRYRPLSIATFAIEHQFFGQNPIIGHLVNLLLYFLTGVLILWVLDLLMPLKIDRKWFWSIPFICGLLFLAHPVHSEVVANIKGRDEIMTFMGSIAALGAAILYSKSRKNLWLILSGFFYALGLLAKENAITFLAVIPIALWFFSKPNSKSFWRILITLLSVTIIYIILRYQVIGFLLDSGQSVTSLINDPFLEMDGLQKSATIMYTLGLYVKLLFFPHPLTHDYYPYHIPIMEWTDIGTIISLLVYLFLAAIVYRSWHKKSITAFSILFFMTTISIVSNVVFSVGTFMNERFIYLSSLGFTLWLANILVENKSVQQGPKHKNIAILPLSIFFIFMIGYIWKTLDRVPAWENDKTLNEAAIKVSGNSARANVFMATQYFNQYKQETDTDIQLQLLDQAAPLIEKSLQIYPRYNDAFTMKLGVSTEYFRHNRQIKPLMKSFTEIAEEVPGHPFMFEYLEYLSTTGQYRQELEEFFYYIGFTHYTGKLKKPDVGILIMEKGVGMVPDSRRLYGALSETYKSIGDQSKASYYQAKANSN
ncbi:MAG: hypothetical protein IPI60_06470 [Saprospiraceae bacterium]|nr:hypothetical protein [Saprospiraceae bacterium]